MRPVSADFSGNWKFGQMIEFAWVFVLGFIVGGLIMLAGMMSR